MKKLLAGCLVVGAVLLFTFVGLLASQSKSASYALAEAAPPPAPPEAPARFRGGEGRMEKKSKMDMAAAAPAESEAAPMADELLADLGSSGGGVKGLVAAKPQPLAANQERPAAEVATRAWFPETFLFEPLVETDAQGLASVPVKVPDRLTTWRVLALAHSREGSQAGAVTSFLGTLPSYVEPVVPPFLYAGDSVRLPIQVVNTTGSDLSQALAVSAVGGTLSSKGATVKVGAGGSAVEYVTLTTSRPGQVVLTATLGDTDAIKREIDLKPAGLREVQQKGGTLAQPRSFTLTGPAGAIPGTERVQVQVYPGALGLLRSELSAAPGRGGVAEDAYLLQLLGRAPALLRSLGAEPDEKVIRELRLIATQRVMGHARAPSVDAAALLTEAALSHPDDPVLSRLGARLATQLANQQRPDGTCDGATGWTLQRLLVSTSECLRAVRTFDATPEAKQRVTVVTLKASGAFERNVARVDDGYTAAAILASGATLGAAEEPLRKLVLEHLVADGDGKRLDVEQGVVRADGVTPSSSEATAMAILALRDVKDAPLADLGTYLLSGYSAWRGWGDGRANLVALRAATQLFKDPVPDHVRITLSRDGQPVTSGDFDAKALERSLHLDADATGSAGAHEWTLAAEPAVPGMGYALQLVSYAPWHGADTQGLTLTTELPKAMHAGRPAVLELQAAVPTLMYAKLELPLPAGVQPDVAALDRLVAEQVITRFETEDGLLTLHFFQSTPGAVWKASVPVTPTLSGSLQSGPSRLVDEHNVNRGGTFAPLRWTIEA